MFRFERPLRISRRLIGTKTRSVSEFDSFFFGSPEAEARLATEKKRDDAEPCSLDKNLNMVISPFVLSNVPESKLYWNGAVAVAMVDDPDASLSSSSSRRKRLACASCHVDCSASYYKDSASLSLTLLCPRCYSEGVIECPLF